MNILVTSASHKIPLIKSLTTAAKKVNDNLSVIAGDINNQVLSKFYSDNFWLMPELIDKNIESILNACFEMKIGLILPTRDGELIFWSSNRERFSKEGIEIIISSQEAIKICLDKQLFYEFGKDNNFPFVFSSESIDIFDSTNKLVVKEKYGSGSESIGINLDINEAKKHATFLSNPIFQPFIKGLEFSADAWLDKKNKVKAVVLRKRELIVNGEAAITETFQNKAVENVVVKVLEKLKLKGPIVLQGIINKNNEICIIECNARFGGASTCSIKAGLESLYWSILESIGHNLDDYPFEKASNQIRQIRVPFDDYQ